MKTKEDDLKIAIEVFDRCCKKLYKHRNPNIRLEKSSELLSNWFLDGLKDLNPLTLGSNSHPDFIVQNVGFELKSTKTKGLIQFNSTIPCGGYLHNNEERECYYVIARYIKDRQFGYLEDFTLVDGDFFNNDRNLSFTHRNSQEKKFGSFQDGIVRYRKMYHFPSPHNEIPGVRFISKYNNAQSYNSNLQLEKVISRSNSTCEEFTFYVYAHDLLV
ncbi:hypothetical protein G9F75_00925 [Bacillus sp. EKM208B]|uniref:hypothetical protein n=1 Tax=Bacillus sp. EKM208B TaxID=1683602 RepID=UPI00142D3064|nr:hypothetical protein [Bacillus sp. EKM208B]KAF6541133.1 hypothetical protein G9F75_00925 [Bacillus sp. EKM208B]